MFLFRYSDHLLVFIYLYLFNFQEAFKAFHNDMAMVRKYMAPLKIGRLSEDPGAGKENRRKKEEEMKTDFEELRLTAKKMVLKYNTIL